jgi:sugar lactone lactonase YvrE
MTAEDGLEKVWEATGAFEWPESPAYDPTRDVIYVSNMAGSGYPPLRHSKGYISVLTTSGEVIESRWVSGLHEVKNIAVHGDRLYAADSGRLVVIDIETAKVDEVFPAPESLYLDGLAVHPNGDVYVSDLAASTIWRLDATAGSFSVWLDDERLCHPDGVVAEPDRLIAGGYGRSPFDPDDAGPEFGHLTAVDYQTKEVTSLGIGTPIGNIDGVKQDGRGGYLVADHPSGKLYQVDSEGIASLLLQTNRGISDIEYIPHHELVVLAMMFDPAVSAYRYHATTKIDPAAQS